MKLSCRKYDCKEKERFCLLLFRQMSMYCDDPNSLLYFAYGAKGIRCDFDSAVDIGFLYTRDNVSEMNDPILARRNESGNFSSENCYFYDTTVTIEQLLNKVYGWES